MLSLITTVPEPAGRSRVYLAPFVAHLTGTMAANSTTMPLAPSIVAELFGLLGLTTYAPILLNGPQGNETVNAYFDAGTLRVTRVTGGSITYPTGTCVSAPVSGPQGVAGTFGSAGAQGAQGVAGGVGNSGIDGVPGSAGANGSDGSPGSVWYFGSGTPNPGTGTNIDYYLNATNGDLFTKGTGSWIVSGSLKGPGGSDGTNGAVWFNGVGAPAGSLGANDDFYINTANGDLYKKAAGTWGVIANIQGPQGVFGNDGANGSRWFFGNNAPLNTFGSSIDYYLDIDSSDWYQKSSGVWALGGSLKGVPGTPGSNGAAGYSQVMHIWMIRTSASNVGRNVQVIPQTNTVRYNNMTGATAGTAGTVDLDTGAYLVTGSYEAILTFASAYSGVAPSLTLEAEVYDGTSWNLVESYSTYAAHLFYGLNDTFTSGNGIHGMINCPGATGGFRVRVTGDWDPSFATANIAMTVKLTVLRVQ